MNGEMTAMTERSHNEDIFNVVESEVKIEQRKEKERKDDEIIREAYNERKEQKGKES